MAAVATKKIPEILKILDHLKATMETRSFRLCVLMTNIGAPIRVFDKEMMFKVFKRCLDHPNELRHLTMTDIECLTRTISLFSDSSMENMMKDIGYHVLDELKNRLDQIASRNFFASFINIIRNLIHIDVYDLELMENIFRADFIKCIYKKSLQLCLPIYEIDGYNRINLRNIYKGNHLADCYTDRLRFLSEYVPNRINRFKKSELFNYIIEDAISRLFKHYQYAHAVPHRRHAGISLQSNHLVITSNLSTY